MKGPPQTPLESFFCAMKILYKTTLDAKKEGFQLSDEKLRHYMRWRDWNVTVACPNRGGLETYCIHAKEEDSCNCCICTDRQACRACRETRKLASGK